MPLSGIVVSPGIAFGNALHLHLHPEKRDYHLLPLNQIEKEKQTLIQVIDHKKNQLLQHLQRLPASSHNYQLIEADLLLLDDDELIQNICAEIERFQLCAAVAIERIFSYQAAEINALDDHYLTNRSQDILSLASRLIDQINGAHNVELSKIDEPTILLASDITPAEFSMLPLKYITALVLKTGGITSHTAILARSAGIPALFDCPFDQESITNHQVLALDALAGKLYVAPNESILSRLTQLKKTTLKQKQQLLKFKHRQTQTIDGHEIPLLVNIGSINETTHLNDMGVEGIGLFRTEFMLMNTKSAPSENKQYRLYSDILHLLNGKLFTIRTLDIGAEKALPFLNSLPEENPALGLRGIRYTLQHTSLLVTQVRAVLRAAQYGPIRLMFPMINQVEELEAIFDIINQCQTQLTQDHVTFGQLSYGIVVETPAAVMNLASMLPKLDFISIGTNDLTQYAMAADRGNPLFTRDYPSLSPAILSFIHLIISTAQAHNTQVSLCGELASDPHVAPLLIGMGVNELSVNLPAILEIKSALSNISYAQCHLLAQKALSLVTIKALHACVYTQAT
ncbi:phosphoenolpyruvate--protein phosphotransferase [Shewanella surugensis]|uniref:Phosphoenolpyruvate-protein phosphotransferase n=1 Tax=Shewanella surugensis TaxID=212020 RepID=A0ABT0LCP6_9GAMM|nr:phosphoenolpyruvate--protein phosphotransferase [Shewanella surugensis]MCL1125477.1 phosphoenolpyruvate--protein phosphotransferase [Shewanella surugensis]